MIKKDKISIIYKVVFSFLLFTGILARAGLLNGNAQLKTFYSFTSISNMLLLFLTLNTLTNIKNKKKISTLIRYYGFVMIVITCLVYHFILLPNKFTNNSSYNIYTYGNIMAHYIAPIMMFIDWLIFDEKGKLSKKDPLTCCLIPIIYFTVVSLYSFINTIISNNKPKYVYFFMDFNELGILGVLNWSFIIILIFLFIVYSIYYIDTFLGKGNTNLLDEL